MSIIFFFDNNYFSLLDNLSNYVFKDVNYDNDIGNYGEGLNYLFKKLEKVINKKKIKDINVLKDYLDYSEYNVKKNCYKKLFLYTYMNNNINALYFFVFIAILYFFAKKQIILISLFFIILYVVRLVVLYVKIIISNNNYTSQFNGASKDNNNELHIYLKRSFGNNPTIFYNKSFSNSMIFIFGNNKFEKTLYNCLIYLRVLVNCLNSKYNNKQISKDDYKIYIKNITSIIENYINNAESNIYFSICLYLMLFINYTSKSYVDTYRFYVNSKNIHKDKISMLNNLLKLCCLYHDEDIYNSLAKEFNFKPLNLKNSNFQLKKEIEMENKILKKYFL